MKTIAIIRRAFLMSVCGMLTVVGGCAGEPSMDTVSPAEIAVNRAIEAKAGEYAPLELRRAQENLDAAKQAMNDSRRCGTPFLESLETSVYTEARAACARDYDMLRTKTSAGAVVAACRRGRGRLCSLFRRATGFDLCLFDEAEGTQKVVRIPAPSASRVAPMVLGGELID